MTRLIRVLPTVLVSAALLAGCGAVEMAQKAMLPSIAVGECTNLAMSDEPAEVTKIDKVDCAQPHKWEAYAEKSFPLEGEYPGEDEVVAQTEEFCANAWQEFVGVAYAESELELQYLFPTESSWKDQKDRTSTCLVGSDDDQTGTLKGANR